MNEAATPEFEETAFGQDPTASEPDALPGTTRWELPALSPRLMPAYRLIWAALFLTALVMTGLTLKNTHWDGPERLPLLRVGINYTRDATPYLLVWEVPGKRARLAGIRPGDHIVELMDSRNLDDALGAVVDAPNNMPVPITVQHSDGTTRRATLATSPREVAGALAGVGLSAPLMQTWTRLILGLGSAIVLIASALLYRQRQNPVAALLSVSSLVAVASPTGIVGYDWALVAAAVAIALTNIATLAFPDGRFATLPSRILVIGNVIWFGVFFVSVDLHAQGIYPSLALSALAVVARYRGSRHATDRQQIRWAALGFAGAALFSAAAAVVSSFSYRFNGLFDTIANDMSTDALDLGNSLCLWGGLSIALLRFRLYDADVAITRSTVWAVVAPLLAITFAALSEVLKVLLAPYFSDGVSLAIAGVLTASLIQPVGDQIKKVVERWSRSHLIALATDLPAAVRDMEEAADLPRMLTHVCRATAPALRVEAVSVVVANDREGWWIGAHHGLPAAPTRAWLAGEPPLRDLVTSTDPTDPLFPLRIPLIARADGTERAIGWLLVGRRPDGSIPDKGAIATLEGLAPTIGHALLAMQARSTRMETLAASFRKIIRAQRADIA